MAVLRNMWFIFLILGVRSVEGKPLVAVRLTGSDEHQVPIGAGIVQELAFLPGDVGPHVPAIGLRE